MCIKLLIFNEMWIVCFFFQNPKRSEVQASLNIFLDTASGFYIQVFVLMHVAIICEDGFTCINS